MIRSHVRSAVRTTSHLLSLMVTSIGTRLTCAPKFSIALFIGFDSALAGNFPVQREQIGGDEDGKLVALRVGRGIGRKRY